MKKSEIRLKSDNLYPWSTIKLNMLVCVVTFLRGALIRSCRDCRSVGCTLTASCPTPGPAAPCDVDSTPGRYETNVAHVLINV